MSPPMKHFFSILVVICIILFIITVKYLIYPPSSGIINNTLTNILSLVTILILLLTLQTYIKIVEVSKETLRVSQDTLSFTKNQTSYDSYFDNYKLFNELSKRKTDVLYEGELLFTDHIDYFKDMTFENIHFNYMEILKNFPTNPIDMKLELVFKKFNHKVQSFINVLLREITRIKSDGNLTSEQKTILITLYRNFILSDYYNLSSDLVKNKEWFDSDLLPPIEITNLLKCNSNNRKVFDITEFLKLYYLLNEGHDL